MKCIDLRIGSFEGVWGLPSRQIVLFKRNQSFPVFEKLIQEGKAVLHRQKEEDRSDGKPLESFSQWIKTYRRIPSMTFVLVVDGWTANAVRCRIEGIVRLPLEIRYPSNFVQELISQRILVLSESSPKSKDYPIEPEEEAEEKSSLSSLRLCEFQERGVQWLDKNETQTSIIEAFIHYYTSPYAPDFLVALLSPNPSHFILLEPSSIPRLRRGGFLCDDPGLGKTVQLIELMNRRGACAQTHKSSNIQGGTLIACDLSLQDQWIGELRDKSNHDLSICRWTPHEVGPDIAAYEVVIISYGTLRAERRRHAEYAQIGSSWTCQAVHRTPLDFPKESIQEIEQGDLVSIPSWRIDFLCAQVGDHSILGYPFMDGERPFSPHQNQNLLTISLHQFEWVCDHYLERCGEVNQVEDKLKISSLVCGACGESIAASEGAGEALRPKALPLLFNIDWRRVIFDESDHMVGMAQTFSDVRLLQTDCLWCVTATPNGHEASFGQTFMKQLLLFFPQSYDLDQVAGWIRSLRDPAFHDQLFARWMLRRTKPEVQSELALPPVRNHRVPIEVQSCDAAEILWSSHAQLEKVLKNPCSVGATAIFNRMLRLLTVQPHMEAYAIADDMGLKPENERLHVDPTTQCPICREEIQEKPIQTSCSHVFCYDCLQHWVLEHFANEKIATCPMCRATMELNQLRLHVPRDSCRGNKSKIRWIQKLICGTWTRREKVIIVVRFVEAAEFLGRSLGVPWIHGKISREKRRKIFRSFASSEDPALVFTMRTVMLGINLTMASHLVIVDIPPKRYLENQLVGRLHRIGQKKPVHVYRLVTIGTIEEAYHDNPHADLAQLFVTR